MARNRPPNALDAFRRLGSGTESAVVPASGVPPRSVTPNRAGFARSSPACVLVASVPGLAGKDRMRSDLSQERLEAKNQTLDKIHKLMQSWEQRITLQNRRLIDRFSDFSIYILLHIRIQSEVWVCRLQKELPEPKKILDPVGGEQRVMANGEERSVLVDNIKLVNTPKGVVTTSIRLERVNGFYRGLSHSMYFSNLVPLVSGFVLRNRELDIAGGLLSRTHPDQLICQMVKCGAQIMDNISGAGNHIEGNSSERGEILKAVSRCRIDLFQDHLLARVPESGQLDVEIFEVLLGPLNLYADQYQPLLRAETVI
jgi:hypothetical protein